MDVNIEAVLIGLGGSTILGILAWFFRRFFRWPFGEAELEEGSPRPARPHSLGPIVQRIGRLEDKVTGLQADVQAVRREREEGERRILDALADHSQASADSMSYVSREIGHLTGRFDEFSGGHRHEQRPRQPSRPTRRK
jgi:hypothetical protein